MNELGPLTSDFFLNEWHQWVQIHFRHNFNRSEQWHVWRRAERETAKKAVIVEELPRCINSYDWPAWIRVSGKVWLNGSGWNALKCELSYLCGYLILPNSLMVNKKKKKSPWRSEPVWPRISKPIQTSLNVALKSALASVPQSDSVFLSCTSI